MDFCIQLSADYPDKAYGGDRVYGDMVAQAVLADRLGFDALYMTGYGTVASYLGVPDAGLASYTDMVARVGHIAGGTKTPPAPMIGSPIKAPTFSAPSSRILSSIDRAAFSPNAWGSMSPP